MPKVMECPFCHKRFPSTTYVMVNHIENRCPDKKKDLLEQK